MKFIKNFINNIKMNLLERYLSDFIDKFKTKNAKVYAIIAAALIGIKAAIESTFGQELIPADGGNIVEWFLFIFALVVGAHTPQNKEDADTEE